MTSIDSLPFSTAAVTGATGHAGNNLVRALLDRGVQVKALVRDRDAALDGLDVERVRGDVRDVASLEPLFTGAEIVFHCAALISIRPKPFPELYEVNVQGPANVAQASRACGVRRIVHFSSIHAYESEPRDEPVDETRTLCDVAPHGFLPPYDDSKAKGERIILDAQNVGVEVVIVNPTSIVGVHDYEPSRMGRFFLDTAQRKLPALVRGSFDWVDVRDIALGAIRAAAHGRSGERYLLTGNRRSVPDFAKLVASETGTTAPGVALPPSVAMLGVPFAALAARLKNEEPIFTKVAIHTLQNHCDISRAKAESELGYTARPLEETIRDTAEWFRAQGVLS